MKNTNIKKLRLKAALTQNDVATYCEVNRATVSKWESGEFYPRTEKLLQMAKLFNCNIDDLLDNTAAL